MKKSFEVRYTAKASKDLKALDVPIAKRVANKVKEYSLSSDPLATAKQLSGVLFPIYRYRVGDYRVLFEIEENEVIVVLMVLRIKHRRDVYRILE